MLTWSLKGQEFGWNWVLSTQWDQVEVFHVSVVISYNTKTTTAAKIGVERNIGHFFLFCCRMETNQTQLLQHRSTRGKCLTTATLEKKCGEGHFWELSISINCGNDDTNFQRKDNTVTNTGIANSNYYYFNLKRTLYFCISKYQSY